MKTHVLMISKVFPATHKRAGEPTRFEEKIASGEKSHTIRGNYELWKCKIDEVQKGEAVLEVREWVGKPYRSKQRLIFTFTEDDQIAVEKLVKVNVEVGSALIEGKNESGLFVIGEEEIPAVRKGRANIDLIDLASNDGLSFADFQEWFKGSLQDEEPKAIIHFADFRYAE